jgi:hypothetical protein
MSHKHSPFYPMMTKLVKQAGDCVDANREDLAREVMIHATHQMLQHCAHALTFACLGSDARLRDMLAVAHETLDQLTADAMSEAKAVAKRG